MAPGGRKSPDKEQDIYYTCHPRKKVTSVFCIICEDVYHTDDFVCLSDTIFLSKVVVVCPKHKDVDLTSKTTNKRLSNDAKCIIAQVKYQEREKYHNEILQNVSMELSKTGPNETHDATVLGDDIDVITLTAENQLLKQLNQELQEKNKLLQELINEIKNNSKTNLNNNLSYASAVKRDIISNKTPLKEQIPDIVVKSTNSNETEDILNHVKTIIQKDIILPIKSVFKRKDGSVIVKCTNKEDASKTIEELDKKMSIPHNIDIDRIKNPRVKVVGIKNEMNQKEMQSDINQRNFSFSDNKCIVKHNFKNVNNKQQTAILEVSSDLYLQIKNNKWRIYVGHQCCRVYDDINLKPCVKCGRFGHSWKKCTNNIVCILCSGNHEYKKCKSQEHKCVDCIYSNEKYNLDNDTNHIVSDTYNCEYLKYKIKTMLTTTAYPERPTIPRYVDNTGMNLKSKEQQQPEITPIPK